MAAKPAQLDPSELTYHKTLVARMQEAQASAQEAARLQQIAAEAQAAFRSWALHLHDKYKLAPTDNIDEDGNILRIPAPNRAARRAKPKAKPA